MAQIRIPANIGDANSTHRSAWAQTGSPAGRALIGCGSN